MATTNEAASARFFTNVGKVLPAGCRCYHKQTGLQCHRDRKQIFGSMSAWLEDAWMLWENYYLGVFLSTHDVHSACNIIIPRRGKEGTEKKEQQKNDWPTIDSKKRLAGKQTTQRSAPGQANQNQFQNSMHNFDPIFRDSSYWISNYIRVCF